ncbi:MAG: SCO family protein [Pseudomonadota bacterium]
MNGVRATVALCLLFVAMVLGAFYLKMTREVVLSPEQLAELGTVLLPRPRAIADVALTDTDGKPYTEASLVGGWRFVFFGFTNCPDICPTTMSVLGQVWAELTPDEQQDFHGVLISVDPERDTPEALARYATAFAPTFIGATGSIVELAKFATQVNVAFAKVPSPNASEPYTMDHTGNVVIINPMGHYHGFVKMPHTRDKLLTTYRTLRATF